MNATPTVCPYCGTNAWGAPFCRNCGAQLDPSAGEWPPAEPTEPAAQAGQAKLGTLELAVVAPAVFLTLLALIATFPPWIPGLSYWEFSSVEDIALVFIALAILAFLGLRLAMPGSLLPRGALAILIPALMGLLLINALEAVALAVDKDFGPQVGMVLALLASAGLGVVLLLLLFLDARGYTATKEPSGRDPLLLVGLALLAGAAFLGLVTSFLPIGEGVSLWELNTVADLILAFTEVLLLAAVAGAVALPRVRELPLLVTAIGSFLAAILFFGAADFLGEGLHGAWTFLTLIIVGPLAIAGTCLVALRSYPSLGLQK